MVGKPAAEALVAEQGLVHARPRCSERRVEQILEAAQHIIGVEHRILGDLPQAVGAVALDIGQCAGEHAHLAVEGGHPPEAPRMMLAGGFFLDQDELLALLFDERSGANGVSASEKTTGPAPGPPPPCGVEKVLWRLMCIASMPSRPGARAPRSR